MTVGTALLGLVLSRDKWVQHRWRRAAHRLNMRFLPGNLLEGDRICGHRSGYPVEVNNLQRKHTSIVLDAQGLPPGIHCCTRTWNYLSTADRLLAGDESFDRLVRVSGPIAELRARLGGHARTVLSRVIGDPDRGTASVLVTGGRIIYEAEYHVESPGRIEQVIDRLASVADALSLDRTVPHQLAAHALNPDEPKDVRRRNLEALVDHYPDDPATRDACDALTSAGDPALRVIAAGHRVNTAPGRRALRAVIEDRSLGDAVRVDALRAIDRANGPAASHEPMQSLLADITRDPSPAVRSAVARSLAVRLDAGHASMAPAGALLTLAQDTDAEVATAALRGLARTFDVPPPQLQAVLRQALRRRAYDVRLAAVDALAVVGTLSAVEPLHTLLRNSFFDQRLRHAARGAIRAIQVRAGTGDTGQLSLVRSVDDGGLSESNIGQVSEASP